MISRERRLFVPLESGANVRADADEIRDEYLHVFGEAQQQNASALRSARITHCLAQTNEPVETALARLLSGGMV